MKKLLAASLITPFALTSCLAPKVSNKNTVTVVIGDEAYKLQPYNQNFYNGAKQVETAYRLRINYSATARDVSHDDDVRSLLIQNEETLLLNGYFFGKEGINTAAKQYNKQNIGIFDINSFTRDDGSTGLFDAPNIRTFTYAVHQSAFIAGYCTAKHFDTVQDRKMKMGIFGGMAVDSVIPYMAGMKQGIDYFNSSYTDKRHTHEVIRHANKADYFSNDFSASSFRGRLIVDDYVDVKGANIIFPVAGAQSAIVANKVAVTQNLKMIGVDFDERESHQGVADSIITSVTKEIQLSAKMYLEYIYGSKSLPTQSNHVVGDVLNKLTSVITDDTAPNNFISSSCITNELRDKAVQLARPTDAMFV